MQLQQMHSDVRVANVGHTSQFNMDANAKAFRVLSDTLYQNKIGSMVREVSCNAFDSHVMAGIPERPFQIHMPDVLEPHFSVRDFGLGLDDAGVREVFTTYFRSTKDQSNNVVGAFGLGSKTPFAYTDAFTIVAIKDGVQRQYSAYIDGNGLPALTLMDENDTTEGNGVEIIVPVTSSEDFAKFRREVQNQLAFFVVKPEILNLAEGNEIEWMDWQNAKSYMNCSKVSIGGDDANFRGVWIVQGVVGYRMDVSIVKGSVSEKNAEFLDIISAGALIHFDLGQIEVTPSREGVSYSKYTLANIEAVLDEARTALTDSVKSTMAGFKDGFEAASYLNAHEYFRRLLKVSNCGFDFPGYFRNGHVTLMDLEHMADIEDAVKNVTVTDSDGRTHDEIVGTRALQFRAYKAEYVRGSYRWKETTYADATTAKPDSRYLHILVRDTNDKPVVRTREYMANLDGYNSSMQVFVVQVRDGGGALTADQIAKLQARIGGTFTFDFLSEVELPEPGTRSPRNGYKSPTAYTYGKDDDFYSTRYWEREYEKIVDFEGGAYYTTVERCRVEMSPKCRVVTTMADMGLLDRPIIAIREKDVEKIASNPDWIRIEVKADEIIESVKGNKTLHNAVALNKVRLPAIQCMNSGLAEALVEHAVNGAIKDDNLVAIARLHRVVNKVKERAAKRGFSRVATVALENSSMAADAAKTAEAWGTRLSAEVVNHGKEFVSKYPLIPFLDDTHYNGWRNPAQAVEHVIQYINSVGA